LEILPPSNQTRILTHESSTARPAAALIRTSALPFRTGHSFLARSHPNPIMSMFRIPMAPHRSHADRQPLRLTSLRLTPLLSAISLVTLSRTARHLHHGSSILSAPVISPLEATICKSPDTLSSTLSLPRKSPSTHRSMATSSLRHRTST